MRIVHHVSIASSREIQRELAQLSISVADSGFVSFDVDESSEAWPELNRWIARYQALDVVRTDFSKTEIASAEWLELTPDWHCGYPQPEEAVPPGELRPWTVL